MPRKVEPMRNVSVMMPQDLIDAINAATEKANRPSASDTIRAILRYFLFERPHEIARVRRENMIKYKIKPRGRRTPMEGVHVAGTRLR